MIWLSNYRSWTLTRNKWGNINRGVSHQLSLYTIDGADRLLKVLGGQKRVGWQEPIVMIHRFTLNGGWRRYLLTVLTSSALYNHVLSFLLPQLIYWPASSVIFASFTCGTKQWRHSHQVLWVYEDECIFIQMCMSYYSLHLRPIKGRSWTSSTCFSVASFIVSLLLYSNSFTR